MNKLFATILLASALPMCSQAQTAPAYHLPGSRLHKAHTPAIRHRVAGVDNRLAAKTTATSTRLVATVYFESDGTSFIPTDSARLAYSGSRGGVPNDQYGEWEWAFDNAFVYPWLAATSTYGNAYYRSSQTFDAGDRVTSDLGEDWRPATSTWRNNGKGTYTYDGAGNMLTSLQQEWDTVANVWKNVYSSTYTYTAANKVATYLAQTWNTTAGAWDPGSKATYTYDAGNKLATILNESWSTSTSAWMNNYFQTNTYDASNNLTLELYQMWNTSASAWENSGRNTNTYDLSNRCTERLYESYTGGVWEPGSKDVYSDFDGTLAQTVTYLSWDGGTMAYVNYGRAHNSYNSDGRVTYYYDEEWDDMTSSWILTPDNTAERNWYETYTTGIAEITTPDKHNMVLYPTPAAETVTIAATWSQPEPFTIAITDMAGRCHSTWSQPAQKNYTETISLTNLPAGNYLVTLQSKTGKTVKHLTVVK